MRRLALLLLALPAVAPAEGQGGRRHRKPLAELTLCGRSCPDELYPAAYVYDLKCPPLSGQANATHCKRAQGDAFVACGESCGWSYYEDREHPAEPSAACAERRGEKGPAVRCRAYGAEAK